MMKRGFTLIELAVVIAIIGLVAGGILVTRNLIDVGKRQAQIVQIASLNGAVGQFVSKYYYLPGDCPNCQALGLQTNDGDGDGQVGWDFGEGLNEVRDVVRALENAGLTGSSERFSTGNNIDMGEQFPAKVGDGAVILVAGREGQNGWFGPYSGSASGMLTAEELKKIDMVIDDGLPYQGDMLLVYIDMSPVDSTEPFGTYFAGGSTVNTNCVSSGAYSASSTSDYAQNNADAECLFWIKANY